MNASSASNPIAQRLAQMSRLWEQFRQRSDARVCRWLIAPDERKMVDVFIETTYLESNPIPDFFLPFYSECTQLEEYARQLVAELGQHLENDREALAREGITINWQPQPFGVDESPAAYFLRQLSDFAQKAPLGELLVAVLLPANPGKHFAAWLSQVIESGIPANLRLLVVDEIEGEKLAKTAASFPDLLHSYTPNLDMPGAMRQLAAVGDPADPGVKFRKAFLDLSQAAAEKNMGEVKRLETLPLTIAREQGWVPMQIAVHSLVATAFIGLNQLPQALDRYELAFGLANAARATGDTTAAILAVQCRLNQGSVQVALKAYPHAARAYASAAEMALQAGDFFQVMEAKRMQGYCLEKDGDWPAAFRVEKEALLAAEQLDEQLRRNSTLPYLAQSLLELAYRAGNKEEYFRLEEKINELAGPDWATKLPRAKSKVPVL